MTLRWERGGGLAVAALAGIDGQEVVNNLMDDVLLIEDCFLHSHDLLQHDLVVDGHLSETVVQLLDLLLLRQNLLVQQVNLLRGDGVVIILGLLARGGGLATNVVEGFLAVGAKLGVFELPCLKTGSEASGGVWGSWKHAYILTVWGLSILFVVLSHFVKIILVELSHKTGEIAVFEMFGQDSLGKFLALQELSVVVVARIWGAFGYLQDDETVPLVTPSYDLRVRRILQHSSAVG